MRLEISPGFRRLLGTRYAAQWSDGVFQAALGGAVWFNPERQADPTAVAAGLAVLLLPYSLLGPFAGALLDRWDRRRVLVAADVLRAGLVAGVAGLLAAGVAGPGLYLGVLAVTGVSRFVLSGLSAALPHVVERRQVVAANAFATTSGAALTAAGVGCAIGLRAVLGAGDAGSAQTTLVAVLGSGLAAVLAAGFGRGQLGPDGRDRRRRTPLRAVAAGLRDGARATAAVPGAAATFSALAAHRVAFGLATLLTLLLFRYAFTDDGPLRAGLPGIGEVVALGAAGLVTAALLTPWAVRRAGRAGVVRGALLVAAAGQLGLAAVMTLPAVLVAAFVVPIAGQVLKLCADAAVQTDVADGARGRVFALYDALVNFAYVGAVAAAAALSAPDGRSPMLLAAAAVVYLAGLAAHELALAGRAAPTPDPASPT